MIAITPYHILWFLLILIDLLLITIAFNITFKRFRDNKSLFFYNTEHPTFSDIVLIINGILLIGLFIHCLVNVEWEETLFTLNI